MRNEWLLCVGASFLRVCSQHAAAPAVAPENVAALGAHGGVVAQAGAFRTEVVSTPDGTLTAWVTDAHAAPVPSAQVTLRVRPEHGAEVPVAMRPDEAAHTYVGRVAGVPEGAYPIEVTVVPAPEAAPVEMVTAPMHVAVLSTPTPRHGGRMQVVGDRVVEVAAGNAGNVALYWSTLDGHEIPASQVIVPTARVTIGGVAHDVPMRAHGAYQLGEVAFAPGASVSVELPTVAIGGVAYMGVEVEALEPTAVLPAVVVAVRDPSPTVVVHDASPLVVVRERPLLVVEHPSFVVVDEPGVVLVPGHAPRGRAHGFWGDRGHGGGGWAHGGGGGGGWGRGGGGGGGGHGGGGHGGGRGH